MAVNRDKFKIMRQRNWNCSVADAQADFGFSPKVNLEEGVRRTVEAYLACSRGPYTPVGRKMVHGNQF